MQKKKFSWKERGNSFSYAFAGLRAVVKTEHNSWIHLGAALLVAVLGFYFQISRLEAIALVLSIALVWMAELLNTAIEKGMDLISTEIDPRIKLVKDLAAAAVLVCAIASLIVGAIIFIPKIF